ncbi:MAG: ChbG/HpnK family deacetylase [Acidimicrobiales bacterium]
MTRHLIVNADDFGQTSGINTGIAEAHERGIVTSASLMVRGAAAWEAARYARAHPELSVGLHLDTGEWAYRGGEWQLEYAVVDTEDEADVAAEVDRQLEAFVVLTGRPPTHLDSHQHVHRRGPVRTAVRRRAARLGIPVRHLTPGITHCGDFYGQNGEGEPWPQGISADALVALLRDLPEGWTELACHPGCGTAELTYGHEREEELAVLCSGAVAAALVEEAVVLRSFHHVTIEGDGIPQRDRAG